MSQRESFSRLTIIRTVGGQVRHGLKAREASFAGFGEAYFSRVEHHAVRAWKRHNRMTLNLIVVMGAIQFTIRDEDGGAPRDYLLSAEDPDSYGRLTVPPGLWLGFGGYGPGSSMLLNVASIEHDPEEADNKPLETWAWSWLEPGK